MTKSRTLPALFLLACAQPALAQPDLSEEPAPLPQTGTPEAPTIVTADEAIAISSQRVRDVVGTVCPQGNLDNEVVVCARRPGLQRYRVPFAEEMQARGIPPRAGDAQLYAMDEGNDQSCTAIGRAQRCGGGLDVIGIGFAVVRGIAQAIANRD